MEAYNPGTNTWQTLAPIPVSTSYPAVAASNGKIFVIGGANGSTWLSNNQVYDIATNTWSAGAPIPSNRMGASAVAYNGRIYVSHGWNGVLMSSLAIYDIATNTWSTGANAPTARYQTGAGLANGKMYVVGGYTSTWVGTNEAYDIATNTWQTVSPNPVPRYLHAVGGDGSRVHVASGYAGSPNNTYQTYDPGTNLWTIQANAPTSRFRVAGACLDGCFYVIGGFNGSATVATLEGYCGWSVLDAGHIELNLTQDDGKARLHWNRPSAWEVGEATVERNTLGEEWFPAVELDIDAMEWEDPFPVEGSNYRIRIQMQDGTIHFSNTVQFTANERTFAVTQDLFAGTLTLHNLSSAAMDLRVFSVSGVEIASSGLDPKDWIEIDTHHLPRGIYFIQWNNGTRSGVTKLLL